MICPYCGAAAKLVDSGLIYGKSYGKAWVCKNYPVCDAYVGCHPGTDNPLGSLANTELRAWRNQAHAAFDPMWKTRKMSRAKAYAYLSKSLNIPLESCHIGMFNIDQCKQVLNLFKTKTEDLKMTNNKTTQVITGKVRISYEHLTKPYAQQPGAEEKYSTTILLPKSDIATKQKIDAAVAAAVQEGIAGKWNGVRPAQIATPIHDGDGVRPNGEAFGAECKGHWVFTASTKQRPEIVDLNLQPILSASEIYSGMYARVSINFFAYFNSGKKGIGCGLGNVQKLEDGEPLGGRTSASDDFGAAPVYAQPTVQTYAQPTAQTYVQQPVYQQLAQQTIDPISGHPVQPPVMGI